MNRAAIAALAVLIAASTYLACEPTDRVWVCCAKIGGCDEVASPGDCPASKDLKSCCGPSTNEDGSVSCGC